MKVSKKYYRVNTSDIGYIRYIFEAHDGIAVISTLPTTKDIIVLRIAPGCEEDVLQIVSGLRDEVSMEPWNMEMNELKINELRNKDKL